MSLAFAFLAFLLGSMVGFVITQAVTGHREKQARSRPMFSPVAGLCLRLANMFCEG